MSENEQSSKRRMEDDGEDEIIKKSKLEVDDESDTGLDPEGVIESDSENEDDWDDAFFLPDSSHSQ